VLHLSPLGDALAFMACLCWAVYSLLMIPATKRYNTIFITRKVFFYGLVSMIPYFMVYPGLGVDIVISQPKLLANLLFLGCIASMACFLAWNWVLKKLGALICTNYVYFNPVVTVIFAWAILSEQITLYFVLGTAFILTGMYLAEKHHSHQ
jgi:drug/metabolite transporter (DMT)-like permease